MSWAAKLLFLLATAGVIAGSCIWAWESHAYWKAVPLYPSIVITGILAAAGLYAIRRTLVPALAVGVLMAVVTSVGTAIITIVRWDI